MSRFSNLPSLLISPALRRQMERDLIRPEDAAQVIRCAQESGQRLRTSEGTLLAHLTLGCSTLWAEYRPEGDAFRLVSAYSHRLVLGAPEP